MHSILCNTLEIHHQIGNPHHHVQHPQWQGSDSRERCGLADHTYSRSCPWVLPGIHGLDMVNHCSIQSTNHESLLICPSPSIAYSDQSHTPLGESSFVVTHHHSCSYTRLAKVGSLWGQVTHHLAGPLVGQSRACMGISMQGTFSG